MGMVFNVQKTLNVTKCKYFQENSLKLQREVTQGFPVASEKIRLDQDNIFWSFFCVL